MSIQAFMAAVVAPILVPLLAGTTAYCAYDANKTEPKPPITSGSTPTPKLPTQASDNAQRHLPGLY